MNLAIAALLFLLSIGFALAGASRVGAWLIERRHPPVGIFADIGGTRLHHVHIAAGAGADLPPLVFIHGASANLLDQMVPLRPLLDGRAEMLFLDRPGHGWSARGAGNEDPYGQARTIVGLMDRYGIAEAIVVGHSFGGAVAAALALNHPDRVTGLLFLAAATHPWPGGDTSWYYRFSSVPYLGRLFVDTLAWPGGMLRIGAASACVFSPNPMPAAYLDEAAIPLVLRPRTFRWNAVDVAGLYDHVVEAARRYGEISRPTIIVSGNSDTVVYEEIHSLGLARDIADAELLWVDNLGHKPEWATPDLVVAAIERLAGLPVDLASAVKAAERRIAADAAGPVDLCAEPASAGSLEQ